MYTTDMLAPRIAPEPGAQVHLKSVGLFRSHGSFRWEQVSPWFVVHCVHSGRGIIEEDGARYRAGPGDLFLFRAGRHYRYNDLPGASWRYDFVTIGGDVPELPGSHAAGPILRVKEFWPLLEELRHACGQAVLDLPGAARLGWKALAALQEPSTSGVRTGLVAELITIVERRDVVLPTVQQLADRLGIDRSTLYRRFKAETGGSIKRWLDDRRMTRAEELLLRSDARVHAIAGICGFRDPQYFSRAFRARHGQAPGEWRQAINALQPPSD